MLFIIAFAVMGSLLLVIVTMLSPRNIGKLVDLHVLRRGGRRERASFTGSGPLKRDLAPALPDPLGEPPALANLIDSWLRQDTDLVCAATGRRRSPHEAGGVATPLTIIQMTDPGACRRGRSFHLPNQETRNIRPLTFLTETHRNFTAHFCVSYFQHMKKSRLITKTISILTVGVLSAQIFTNVAPRATATSLPPIYVSIVTHNEQPDSGRYPDFTSSEADFTEQRDAVIAFAEMLHDEGASYNWQSAWNFLLAATMFDDGSTATNGKNIVSYLQSLGFSVNVHGHASSYSYADDAYLIDALGATPSGIMGGFVATPSSSSELEDLWDTQEGNIYSYSWTPTAAWGASGFGHQGDDDVQISGIWKPKNNENFLTHSDSAPLPVIGTYTSDWDGLTDLLTQQANGELDSNSMYTATIMVDQDELLTESERSAIQTKIEALKDETSAGRIIWTTLEDALSTWETTYNSTPSLYQASSHTQLSVTTSHTTEAQNTSEPATTTVSTAGALIKTACDVGATAADPCTAVYYLTSDGQRHAFPNDKVFFTWYENFDDVVTISAEDMAAYTIGKNVTYRPGTRMVKFVSANTVYAVSRRGELRPISSEAVATELYGASWNTQIDDISDAFYGNYVIGNSISSATSYNPSNAEAATPTIEINFNGT